MIDFTDRETLITVKTALIRAMNSLDNEIGGINIEQRDTPEHFPAYTKNTAKLEILTKSRDNMRAIYNEIDAAIIAATR
jgi:hypothetical protein